MNADTRECKTCALFDASQDGEGGSCDWPIHAGVEIPYWLNFSVEVDPAEALIDCPAWRPRAGQERAA